MSLINDRVGRPFLFTIVDNVTKKPNNVITALVNSIDFKYNSIIFKFMVHPNMFTWLDSYNNQTNDLVIDLLLRTGDTLQRLEFKKVKLIDKINTKIQHDSIALLLQATVKLKYKSFEFVPMEPNEDTRYLFKKFLENKGRN